jgi:ribosomal protein L3 glutamine methyltransferase
MTSIPPQPAPAGGPGPASIKVIDLIEAMAQRLAASRVSYGHGTANAFDEAAWLTLWKLGLPIDNLDEVADEPVAPARAEAVREVVEERIHSRKPAAYLTREAWLQGVPFYVDERAIVPRSFIAELLGDGSIDPWLSADSRRALDLCTGNGSLAVLTALAYPDLAVDAADISAPALEVARINVARHGLASRIRLIESDGLAKVQGRYDLIVCNPPYVTEASMARLPEEYQAEPRLALAGGSDGMDFIRQLLVDVADKLEPGGVLVLEVGHEREHFQAAFPRLDGLWLDTSAGPDMVVLITAQALRALSGR